jgi:putative peptidoglycan lipid II flippase
LWLGAITALGAVFSRQVIAALTIMGGSATNWDLAVYLNRIILPYIFIVSLGALAAAILNSLHVFGLPAASPILFNLSMIVFSLGVVYRPIMRWAPVQYRSPAVALAVGVLVGGSVQLAVLLRAVYVRGMRFRPQVSFSDPGVRTVGRLMIPGFLGIGVYQINFFMNTVFATSRRLPAGSVTSLYVADRVMELTLGCFAIAVSTAILPMLSRQAVAGKIADMRKTFEFALRMVLFVTIPAAAGLILLREPIVQVLFQHGKFSAQSTALTSRALLYYSTGPSGIRGNQAGGAFVLFPEGHGYAGAGRGVRAGAEYRAEPDFYRAVFRLALERRTGAGDVDFRVHEFFGFAGHFPRRGLDGGRAFDR